MKLGVKKIIVCPNAIEHRYILESRTMNEGGLMFLFIGRNDKAKGFPMLLEALKLIKTAKNITCQTNPLMLHYNMRGFTFE